MSLTTGIAYDFFLQRMNHVCMVDNSLDGIQMGQQQFLFARNILIRRWVGRDQRVITIKLLIFENFICRVSSP